MTYEHKHTSTMPDRNWLKQKKIRIMLKLEMLFLFFSSPISQHKFLLWTAGKRDSGKFSSHELS